MRADRDNIVKILCDGIDELSEMTGDVGRTATGDTPILGGNNSFDSLGFVNFIALVEEKCETAFGVALTLTGQDMDTENGDPFETVGTLADHILRQIG